ncbi:hypothetical protein IEQ34_021101 [Dendrobium chrysotoxum]|uniref:Uncharacterized protein n=1 Tax=Dendrobium chrysotoxum TaxID=161865 RepID=A0AAV7G451_DENCH|nr:hypothetical protein IEQ34_021101 [Dendrobium chrysotoxum]
MPPGTRVHIVVNENNVPCNILESVLLGSYLGVIARDHILAPISFLDWRTKGMEPFKKKMLVEAEAIKYRLLLWRINRLHKDGTWSSEDAKQKWIQACELLAEDGLTPEDGNVEANDRVFSIVMGLEYPSKVRTQGIMAPKMYDKKRASSSFDKSRLISVDVEARFTDSVGYCVVMHSLAENLKLSTYGKQPTCDDLYGALKH